MVSDQQIHTCVDYFSMSASPRQNPAFPSSRIFKFLPRNPLTSFPGNPLYPRLHHPDPILPPHIPLRAPYAFHLHPHHLPCLLLLRVDLGPPHAPTVPDGAVGRVEGPGYHRCTEEEAVPASAWHGGSGQGGGGRGG